MVYPVLPQFTHRHILFMFYNRLSDSSNLHTSFSPLFILDTCRLLSVYDVHYNYTCIVVSRSYALHL